MIYDFVVHEQEIKRTDVNRSPVDNSANYLILRFTFDYSWKDLKKFIILQYGDLAYNLLFDETQEEYAIKVPSQILQGKCFSFSLYGRDLENNTRITTEKVLIKQRKSGYTTCFQTPHDEDIDDVYTVLQKEIDALNDDVDDLEENKSDVGHKHTVGDVTDIANHYESLENKKTDISGDFSNDTVSYPTVKAVKERYETGTVKNNHKHTVSDITDFTGHFEEVSNKTNDLSGDFSSDYVSYPTARAVNLELADKADIVDVPTKVSDLPNDAGYLTSHQSLSDVGGIVTVEEQGTAETGYFKTYVVKQGSSSSKSQVGVKINIPKDFLVKSGEVKTCETADVPVEGYNVGDKYIDFVVNTKDGSVTDEHMYILVSDLVDDYLADGSTLELNTSTHTFSIKDGGVGSNQIASSVKNSWEVNSNKVTSLSSSSTDTEYPSAKCVYDAINSGAVPPKLILTYDTSEGMTFSSDNTTPFTFTGTVTVDWGDGNTETYTDGRLQHTYSSSGVYTITVTGNITRMNNFAFSNTPSINAVINVNANNYSFMGSNLKSSVITNNVTTLGQHTFSGCSNLETVIFESATPLTLGAGSFYNVPTTCKIYVPKGSLSAYTSAGNYPSSSDYTYIEYEVNEENLVLPDIVDGVKYPVSSDAVHDALAGKADTNHTHSQYLTDSDIVDSVTDGNMKAVTSNAVYDSLAGKSDTSHTHNTTAITNSTTLSNLGDNLTTQDAINQAINTKIGNAISYINL